MHILIVFGTRPEAIKMAPLIKQLQQHPAMTVTVCATFQHSDLLEQVLERFSIHPTHNLAVMTEGQTLAQITTRVLTGMQEVLAQEKPQLALVHGDTTTTLAAALGCFYAGVPIGHVEAGLRTHHKRSPFPEEMNRRLTDSLADYHFAPTDYNKETLLREGYPAARIHVTGNTIVDVIKQTLHPCGDYQHPVLQATEGKRRIFATVHRRESFGEPMRRILRSFRRLVEQHEELAILYPVHPNPQVRKAVHAERLDQHQRIHLLEPLDVWDCHNLLARCSLVLTDSGGLQEEAPSFGIPTLVTRMTTDRPEAVAAGLSELVGTHEEDIVEATQRWLAHLPLTGDSYQNSNKNPYGDSHASLRIVQAIAYHFNLAKDPPIPFAGSSNV